MAWVGFTLAGLAAVVFVLQTIYSRLISSLTGVATPAAFPVEILIFSGVLGFVLGLVGVAMGTRRQHRTRPSTQLDDRPDESIAA